MAKKNHAISHPNALNVKLWFLYMDYCPNCPNVIGALFTLKSVLVWPVNYMVTLLMIELCQIHPLGQHS